MIVLLDDGKMPIRYDKLTCEEIQKAEAVTEKLTGQRLLFNHAVLNARLEELRRQPSVFSVSDYEALKKKIPKDPLNVLLGFYLVKPQPKMIIIFTYDLLTY